MKLKNILIITIAIVTLGLVVACSDDVVVTNKDNNQDYTQVLTSNGAFEYNGTKYDTLQLALKAIVDGKGDIPDVKTIKVLRDVTGPGASISAEKTIVLDLDGHTLTFIDVEKEALTAGGSVNLTVKNGTLALEDKNNSDLAVVYAKDATALTFNGVVINAAGQNALVSTGTNSVTIDNGSAITGNTTATGGNYFTVGNNVTPDNSSLSGVTTVSVGHFYAEEGSSVAGILVAKDNSNVLVLNIMEAGIYLESGADLTVDGEGHATLKSIEEGCVVIAKDESAITNETGGEIVVQTGTSYISRDGVKTYYGDLKAALDSLDEADREIVLIRSENNVFSSALSPNNNYSVIINLGSFSIEPTGDNKTNLTSTGAITLKADSNSYKIDGDVTAADVTLYSVTVTGNVVSNGDMLTQNAVIEGTVNVNNDGTLTDGTAVTANNTTTYANGSEFKGNIKTSGLATFNNSKFTPVLDVAPTITSTLAYDAEKAPNGVVINNATGTAGAITAASGVVINNSGITSSGNNLTTGVITAKHASADTYYDVVITGPTSSTLTIGNSTSGSILYAKGVTSKRAVFAGIVGGALTSTSAQPVASLTDGTYTPAQGENPASYEDGSTFHGAVTATGSINLTDSVLNPSSESANDHFVYSEGSITIRGVEFAFVNYTTGKAGVWADKGASISITDSKGVAHKIVTKNASGSVPGAIVINNSGLTGTFGVQGDITSNDGSSNYNDVTLTGKSSTSLNNTNTYVYGNITGNDISLDYTTVNGNVKAYDVSGDNGSVVATNSTVGDSSTDVVYARDIRISNSTVNVAKLIKGVEVVNEEDTDVPADLIHLENVIGTVVEAKVAAASAVDYSANNAGTSTDPVYYAFYLKNAFTSGNYGDSYNFNINKVTSAGGTGTSSTASEPDQTVQAVYINNANTVDRYINSAGVGETLSSIAATNGDVNVEIDSNGSSVISITGSIATTGSGNVVLKGKNTDKRISVIGAVSSVGSVTTQFCDITGAVSGTTITDNTSTFHNAINASGLVTFNNSYFNPATAGATAITSTLPYDAEKAPNGVVINNATGTAGAITAASGVVIDNASASATLATGTITAKSTGDTPSYYNVTVKGNSTNKVTVASIPNAADVSTSCAVVSGAVGSTETPVASLTDGTVSNNTYSNGSKFQGDVTATGAVVLYNSTTEEDVTSTTSISAYNATLGDGADEIFAPVVSITDNSKIKLNRILGNGSYAAATSVTITNPAKYSSTESSISSIITASLSVTANNDNLTVTSATATGAATINGGTFNKTALSGTTNINGGKFTEGSLEYDHSLSGKTTITGGIFTAAVKLSGEYANSITDCSFNDGTAYGSFTYTGTGTLNISGGNFQGSTTFSAGTTTITGGSFGTYTGSSATNLGTTVSGSSIVYMKGGSMYYKGGSTSGGVTFTKGTVSVANAGNLAFVGSHVYQNDFNDKLTISLIETDTLTSDITLSSTVLDLTVSVASGKYLHFDSSTSPSANYDMYLASSTGNYTLSGTFDRYDGTSYIYYHQGVNITNNMSGYSDVTLHTF